MYPKAQTHWPPALHVAWRGHVTPPGQVTAPEPQKLDRAQYQLG